MDETTEKIKALGFYKDSDEDLSDTFIYKFVERYKSNQPDMTKLSKFVSFVGHEPTWNELTDDLLLSYRNFLKENLREITAYGYCSVILAILKIFSNRIPATNLSDDLYWKVETRPNAIYLNEIHLDMLHCYKPMTDTDICVKRLFMIMCYTGCSLEDAKTLSLDNYIERTKTIFYTTEKNGVEVSVPASERLVYYLKYDTDKEINMSAVALCKAIKRIVKRAGISDSVTFADGSQKKYYEIVSMVTAQRTFATNLYNNGYDEEDIQTMMGLMMKRNAIRYIVGYVKAKDRNKDKLFLAK